MRKLWVKTAVSLALAAVLFVGTPGLTVCAEGTATVVANSANVRQNADSTSTVVGSVKKDQVLNIQSEATDGSGMVWYQVTVDGATGYIRSDLVNTDGGSAAAATDTNTSTNTEVASTTDVTAMPAQGATVTTNDVRVRSSASTSGSVVTTVANGTAVTVNGQATDSSGKVWYQVSFISNGSEVTGFIRYDFIELGEVIATEEETPEEEPSQETEVTEPDVPTPDVDYALEYTTNPDGEYEWYLNDYTNSRRQKLNDLLSAQEQGNAGMDTLEATIAKQKTILIVLAVVVILLAILSTVLGFKLHEGAYSYDEDEEDDDDEEDDEDEPERFTFKKRKFLRADDDDDDEDDDDDDEEEEDEDDEEEERRPVRRPRQQPARPKQQPARPKQQPAKAKQPVKRAPEVSYDPEEEVPGKKVANQEAAPRKSRNFLMDDDEFEFEFLNLNDKK